MVGGLWTSRKTGENHRGAREIRKPEPGTLVGVFAEHGRSVCVPAYPVKGFEGGSSCRSSSRETAGRLRSSPDGRPVGERVIRRLEAALKPPSRVGIDGSGATPRDGGQGCENTPASEPAPGPRTGGSLSYPSMLSGGLRRAGQREA